MLGLRMNKNMAFFPRMKGKYRSKKSWLTSVGRPHSYKTFLREKRIVNGLMKSYGHKKFDKHI